MFPWSKNRDKKDQAEADAATRPFDLNPNLPMRLKIDCRSAGEACLIDLGGQLVMGNETAALSQQIQRLVEQSTPSILINLKEISFIDSSGGGELVAGLSRVRKSGGCLKLFGASGMVREVLKVTHVMEVLNVYESEQEAVASLD